MMLPVRPERVSASVHVTAKRHGQVSWLKVHPNRKQFGVSSQWRDRTGFSPVSLFSPGRSQEHFFTESLFHVDVINDPNDSVLVENSQAPFLYAPFKILSSKTL